MMIERWHALSWAVAVVACTAGRALAGDCKDGWSDAFGPAGVNLGVNALEVFDDGRGPALYAGGAFTRVGDLTVGRIARFDGERWDALDGGVDGSRVFALAVFDDGAGPALYVGGYFTGAGESDASMIARWDGQRWTALGSGVDSVVDALAVFDGALYVGGAFTSTGGEPAAYIARWDGTSWSALADGVNDRVEALVVWDDGTGPALYVGGWFTEAGGAEARSVARWDGENWSSPGAAMDGSVEALAVFDDGTGSGPALYAGGRFTEAGGTPARFIARYDGASWSPLRDGVKDAVKGLAVHDDGTGGGPALYALGHFEEAAAMPARHIARWDGAVWSPLGAGMDWIANVARSFAIGGRSVLVVGGHFLEAGDVPAERLARWDGTAWASFDRGVTGDYYYHYGIIVFSLLAVDRDLDGSRALYVGGDFVAAGGVAARSIARFDGTTWSALGEGFGEGQVMALGVFDDGTGAAVYAGGSLSEDGGAESTIARWDGSKWSAVGGGVTGVVHDLAFFDDGSGPAIYAGGWNISAGGTSVSGIARWDGSAWSGVGGGLDGSVRALAVFDGALYAGGDFETAGGTKVDYIARWDGSAWTDVGGGVEGGGYYGPVQDMVVFDGALYVGGDFETAGGITARNIARWDGTSWSAVGGGILGPVLALATGEHHLFVGGGFQEAGGTIARLVARWNGSFWSPLDSGIQDGYPSALAVFDDGGDDGPALYAGGLFSAAGGLDAQNLAKWTDCPTLEPPPYSECLYQVEIIESPGSGIHAFDINERGDVSGYWGYAGSSARPYLWTDEGGLVTIEDLPGAPTGYGRALNDARQVVGETASSSHPRGFLFHDGEVISLPPPMSGGASGANAINNHGLVAGWRSVGNQTYPYGAFLWTESGGFADLGVMGRPNSTARDVNDATQVVGYVGGPYDEDEAFLWQDGTLTMLGFPPGGSSSRAEAINERGQVAVNVDFEDAGIARPFLWERGRWTELGAPHGLERCSVVDVNIAGVAVGYCSPQESNNWYAVQWRDEVGTVLDDVVPWDLGLRVFSCGGINETGQVAASAYFDGRTVAVRLTPVQRPPADMTGDCRVDDSDLLLLLFEWGDGPSIADLDGDGAVGITDLLLFLSLWTGIP